MARDSSSGNVLLRVLLVLAGLGLLLVAWGSTKLPRGGDQRIEAALEVVGVETGGSYAWILRTATGAVLIDAGMEVSGEAIREELDAQGIPLDKVHAVLLTHGHADHRGAAHLFPNAKVYCGPGDAPYVRGDRAYSATGGRLAAAVSDKGPPPGQRQLEELKGDELLTIDGESLKVIHVPGHTPGSVVYQWRDLLFTGDALVRDGKGVGPSPSFFSEDADRAEKSLEKLLELPFTRIADGHTGVTADARQKLARWLR